MPSLSSLFIRKKKGTSYVLRIKFPFYRLSKISITNRRLLDRFGKTISSYKPLYKYEPFHEVNYQRKSKPVTLL